MVKATAGSTIIITDVGGVQLGTVKADANGDQIHAAEQPDDGAHTLAMPGPIRQITRSPRLTSIWWWIRLRLLRRLSQTCWMM
ncbi:hypothetical protein KIF59_23150 [Enterobacter cloacae subsp. cloacae]|nr:hypothetical protein [Enterobacter cloacae subsp. cloacae]